MDARFGKKMFDEAGYKAEINRLQKGKEIFVQNISDLQSEGFSVDLKSIEKYIGMSDEAWHEYIGGMLTEYLGKLGFVLKEEKHRIAGLYQQLFERTVVLIRSIRAGINQHRFQLIDVDGIVAINDEGTADALRRKYTKKINSEAVEEYYKLVCAVRDAVEKIKNFEEMNGLEESLTRDTYLYLSKDAKDAIAQGIAVPPRETNLMKYIKEGCKEDVFLDMVAAKFVVNNV